MVLETGLTQRASEEFAGATWGETILHQSSFARYHEISWNGTIWMAKLMIVQAVLKAWGPSAVFVMLVLKAGKSGLEIASDTRDAPEMFIFGHLDSGWKLKAVIDLACGSSLRRCG